MTPATELKIDLKPGTAKLFYHLAGQDKELQRLIDQCITCKILSPGMILPSFPTGLSGTTSFIKIPCHKKLMIAKKHVNTNAVHRKEISTWIYG